MRISIPSDINLVKETSEKVQQELKKYALAENILFDIKLCFEEAVINAIKHGNRGDKNLSVDIELGKDHEKVKLMIKDEGPGFDFKEVADPTQPENIEKHSGRGVFLIKRLMDEVEFTDNGKTVIMTKFIKNNPEAKS